MRSLILAAVLAAAPGACSLAQIQPDHTPDCIARLMRDTRAGDSVTVTTRDSTVIHGVRPVINTVGTTLYLRQLNDSGLTSGINIPFADIQSFSYQKPGPARATLTLVGYFTGTVAGLLTARALISEGGDWDFDDAGYFVMGGIAGGVIGAVAGNQLGKGFTVQVVVPCD
jgi:hypothetical protein